MLSAQSGDREAFNALVRKYRQRVLKTTMRYTRHRADAEDAVQDTFLKAYCALRHFRGDSEFYSWLQRIAINSAVTVISLRKRNARASLPDTPSVAADPGAMRGRDLDSPESLALTGEICETVNSAIEDLCEEQRVAIVLREFNDLSYKQLAAAMSCPVGTVRSRVFRAREAIDHRLRGVFDDGLGRNRYKRALRVN